MSDATTSTANRSQTSEKDAAQRGDEMERALAKNAAWLLPAASVAGAAIVGAMFGLGPAILVLAAGGLVGVIALLWASLRTLAGDAPLAEGLADAMARRTSAHVNDAEERKRRVLRALKDLEHEHSVRKIDDADYTKISARYRDEAKAILREIDADVAPLRARAEELARSHLKKAGLTDDASRDAKEPPSSERDAEEPARESSAVTRVACPKCSTSNEPDAAFCKKCGARLGEAAEATDASA